MHDKLAGDAWMCGRVTMAGYAQGEPPAAYDGPAIPREDHVATRDAKGYAIGLDAHARMHWGTRHDITGDHVVMILTEAAPDAHLDALRRAGVSYLFGGAERIDLALVLDLSSRRASASAACSSRAAAASTARSSTPASSTS